ncbi:MAG: CNNM domain-containing protein [Elusimicrobiota bacterium]
MVYIKILAAIFFLFLNFLFVLIEFAIVKVRNTKLEELAQKGSIPAKISLEIVSNINSYLASIQLGVTIASIGLGWIAQPLIADFLNSFFCNLSFKTIKIYSYTISIGIAFIIVTTIHIILGEQVPKYIAISFSEKIATFFAIPLKIFYKITYYPMFFINHSSEFIIRLIGIKKEKDEVYHSEDEIRLILSKSEELGKISLGRLMMFEHLFDFGKTTVKEIMVPKEKIVSIDINASFSEFVDVVCKYKFSRYPVKSGEVYAGFIHIKDILNDTIWNEKKDFKISNFIREIKSISYKMLLEKALRYFQENNSHIALVEDENKQVVGFLSVEDIIEDLTGEIRDEFEKRPQYRLDKILDKESSIMELNSGDRFSAIEEMIEKLFEKTQILNKNDIRDKILKRERSFSTAIGHQFAIPHARIEGLKKPVLIIGRHKDGIYFPSPDNKPVKIIFMILTPYNDPSIQLNILSKISKLVLNLTLRKKIFKAQSIEKIEEIFTIFEDNIPID